MTYAMIAIDQKHSEWPKGLGVVQCPSQGDHQAEIKQLLEDIPREEEQVETHPLTYKVKYGEVNQAQREGYAALVHPLEQMRARLAFCQNTDRDGLKFGDVAFSSGFRIAEGNHALDWAIIDVQTSRLGQNTVSHFNSGFRFLIPDEVLTFIAPRSQRCRALSIECSLAAPLHRMAPVNKKVFQERAGERINYRAIQSYQVAR